MLKGSKSRSRDFNSSETKKGNTEVSEPFDFVLSQLLTKASIFKIKMCIYYFSANLYKYLWLLSAGGRNLAVALSLVAKTVNVKQL